MRPISLPRLLFSVLGLVALAAGCSDANTLPPAQYDNVVDTTVLYALSGTAIELPSAFDGVGAVPVRTDLGAPFDFAVDFDPAGTLLLYPAGALGFAPEGGIRLETRTFDAVTSAPAEGYVTDSVVTGTTGTVFVLRSRSSSQLCAVGGSLPRYGKFHVLAIDQVARAVRFEFLVDLNCGYRGLEPGPPDA